MHSISGKFLSKCGLNLNDRTTQATSSHSHNHPEFDLVSNLVQQFFPFVVLCLQLSDLLFPIEIMSNPVTFDDVLQVYGEEKLFKAESMLDSYLSALETDEERTEVENLELSQQIRRDCKKTRAMLDEMDSSTGWTLQKEDSHCRVYYRHDETTPIHSIKMEGEMDCNIFHVLSVVNEIDLYTKWVPQMKRSERCAQIGRARQVGHFEISLPWPVANRESTVYGFGADLLDEKGFIAVHVESITSMEDVACSKGYELESDSNPEGGSEAGQTRTRVGLPAMRKGNVEAIVHLGGMVLEPVSEDRTVFRIVVNCDPQLALVPYWLINFITRHFAHWIFHKLRKTAMHIAGTEYETRIAENDELYGFLRRRLDEFFQARAVQLWHSQDAAAEQSSTDNQQPDNVEASVVDDSQKHETGEAEVQSLIEVNTVAV